MNSADRAKAARIVRDTAACWMAEDGARMEEIAAYLGHSDATITARVYAKFSPTFLKGAAASLEMKILK